MKEAKVRFLFGEVPEWADLEDEDHRIRLLEEANPAEERPAWALQSVIANQIIGDTPPEVWEVAKDLVDAGLDRREVLEQLTLTLAFFTRKALHEKTAFDEAAYAAALRRLPLPDLDDVSAAIMDATVACQGIDFDRLVALVVAGVARQPDDVLAGELVDGTVEHLTE